MNMAKWMVCAHHKEGIRRIQRKHKNCDFSGTFGSKRRRAGIADGAQVLLQHGTVQIQPLGACAPPLRINLHHGGGLDGASDGKRNGRVRFGGDGQCVLHVRVSLAGQFQQLELARYVVDTQTSATQAQRFVVPAQQQVRRRSKKRAACVENVSIRTTETLANGTGGCT
jgi:hypothetical protein